MSTCQCAEKTIKMKPLAPVRELFWTLRRWRPFFPAPPHHGSLLHRPPPSVLSSTGRKRHRGLRLVTGQAAGRHPPPWSSAPTKRQDSGAAVGAASQTSEPPAIGTWHVSPLGRRIRRTSVRGLSFCHTAASEMRRLVNTRFPGASAK